MQHLPSPAAGGRIERFARQLLLLAAFSIPFSTALTNIFAGLTLIAFVPALLADRSLARPLASPAALLALALLALVLVGGTWSIAPPNEVSMGMRKYAKLLLLPVAICLCCRAPGLPARVLRWSLAGSAVLATSLYLVWIDMMPTSSLGWWRVGDTSDPFAFRNHITAGILLSFAACAAFLLATHEARTRARWAWLAAGLYFGAPILMGNGRTGYVGLFIGLFALYLLRARVTLLRSVMVAALISTLFAGAYVVSPNLKLRMDLLVTEVAVDNPASPNGLRKSYMKVGIQSVLDRPLLGHGTGSFAEVFAPEARRIWAGQPNELKVRHQPHSEPLLLAVQFGLIGAGLYFALLGAIGKAALRRRDLNADALALLVAIYGITSLFNSLLWNPTEACWFLLLAGALYGHCMQGRSTAQKAFLHCIIVLSAADMNNDIRISLVIATYNWPEALRACVEGCFRQSDRNFEIIIADDGSGEATRALVEELCARSPMPMRHVWQPDDGFRLAESRNNGILAATGNYIVTLDGDCVPQRDFIARHRALAEPGYMLTGSRILLSDAFSKRVLREGIDLQSLSLADKLRYRLQGGLGKAAQLLIKLPDIGRRRHRFSFRRIKGCNMAFWRADLEKVNGFDESFRGWGYEDSDAVARLFHAGVMRKDGAYATEVFHLWHREATRDQASSNHHIVIERCANKTTQAAIGLREHGAHVLAAADKLPAT